MPTNIDAIPEQLKSAPQWVVWRMDEGRKMPYNARNGRQAQSNNNITWATFDEATTAYNAGGYDGLGFVFDADDPWVGIDLDDCIDGAGVVAAWAEQIVSEFGSYAEISPSGTGIKIWTEGARPSNIGHTAYETGAIEMYHKLRFFTMTGEYVQIGNEDRPAPIRYVNGPLDALHAKVMTVKRGNKPEHAAAPVGAVLDGGINEKRLSAYVQRAFEAEIAAVALAPDGHKHDTLRNAAIKVASLFAHGLDENAAFDALYNAIAGRSRNANEATDTIRDGFNFGRATPRDLAGKFEERQPWFDGNGTACCDIHKTPLVRTVAKDAWRCNEDFKCFYWPGVGYEPNEIIGAFGEAESEPIALDIYGEIPRLPIDIDFDLGRDAGRWLNRYVEYSKQVSPMSPLGFHETAGLWLFSVAIARRLVVRMPFGDVHPNLFVVWIANTTIWGKTTTMNTAVRMARRAFPHLLAPQDTTPETMISDMSGKAPSNEKELSDEELAMIKAERDFCAQRGLLLDEISGLISSASKEYNAGLLEAFMRFYDCDGRYVRSTKSGGRIAVNNAYVSVLGASTPAIMAQHLANAAMWSNGWWPRFAIITPDTDAPCEDDGPDEVQEHPQLMPWLHKMYAQLPQPSYPQPAQALNVRMCAGVLDLWKSYSKPMRTTKMLDGIDERLMGTYGRMPVQVIKVATILAAMDWSKTDAPVIEMKHMVRAIEVCEGWRASAHRAIRANSDDMAAGVRKRIIRLVTRAEPHGNTLRDLHRMMKDVDLTKLQTAEMECLTLGDI
jgi:hypothetical protein